MNTNPLSGHHIYIYIYILSIYIEAHRGATHVHRKYTEESTYTNAFKLKMKHISLKIPQALKLMANAT
jgi:hypothetical protein